MTVVLHEITMIDPLPEITTTVLPVATTTAEALETIMTVVLLGTGTTMTIVELLVTMTVGKTVTLLENVRLAGIILQEMTTGGETSKFSSEIKTTFLMGSFSSCQYPLSRWALNVMAMEKFLKGS